MGFDLLSEIRAAPDVVDLVISFAFASAAAGTLIHTFPVGVTAKDLSRLSVSVTFFCGVTLRSAWMIYVCVFCVCTLRAVGREFSFMKGQEKDVNTARLVMNLIPSIATMAACRKPSELKT